MSELTMEVVKPQPKGMSKGWQQLRYSKDLLRIMNGRKIEIKQL